MSLRPYIHELLRYHHSLDNFFFFFFQLWLNFFFVSYLYFYVALNPKFESPKKKNNNSAAARPDPWILLIFETVQPFSDGELEVEVEEEEKKKQRLFDSDLKTFYDIPRYPKPDRCQWVCPPLLCIFFWSKILPFHHQTIKNVFLCW